MQIQEAVTKTVLMSFTLPHVLFNALFLQFRTTFDKLFIGDGGGLGVEGFWKEVSHRRDPRIQHHGMLERESWHKYALPFAFHGDGVACIRSGRSGSKSLDVFSWHGLLFRGPTLFMKHLICSVFASSITEGYVMVQSAEHIEHIEQPQLHSTVSVALVSGVGCASKIGHRELTFVHSHNRLKL